MNVRAIADGAWGFAASSELGRGAVEATAAKAVEIARASARVKRENVHLAPEKPAVAEWSTPFKIDPFTISVEQHIDLLLKIDAELRAVSGVTLAEANLNFNREEQWLMSSEGVRYSPDQALDRRGICSVRIRRKRNSKAIVPELFWRPMAEQGIRAHR